MSYLGASRSALGVVAIATLVARPMSAQSSPAAAGPQPCSYDACALRVERGWFSERIVQGSTGTRVATLNAFGPTIVPLVQRSDSAVAQARNFQRDRRRGTVLTLAGLTMYIVAAANSHFFDGNLPSPTDAQWAAMGGGLVLTLVGAHFELRAERALSRALWWNNRELR